jgi:hypothetical protein
VSDLLWTIVDIACAGVGKECVMSKHTPAPWTLTTVKTSVGHAHKIGPFNACLYVDHRDARETDRKTVEAAANAHLMVASPELLTALVDCLDHCMLDWTSDDPRAVRARAAIAKATGQ